MSYHTHIDKVLPEKVPYDSIAVEIKPFEFKKDVDMILSTLSKRISEINSLKAKNFELLKMSKNLDLYYYLCIEDIYDELLWKLKCGMQSAIVLQQFMQISNLYNKQLSKLSDEATHLRDGLSLNTRTYIHCINRYSRLGLLQVACEEIMENVLYSLFLLDEFDLNKEKYEHDLWNIAIGNNSETIFILLPRDLLRIKWFCNKSKDDISDFNDQLTNYCEHNPDDVKLFSNLCYVAYRFFECFNYKCSLHILSLSMNLLNEKRTDSKEKYIFFSICKGMLLLKLKNYDDALKLLMDGVKHLRSKLGIDMMKDILLASEFMNIGSLLIFNDFNDFGTSVLELCSTCFERYLPNTFDLWIESLDLIARSQNDTFDFTMSLLSLAPGFDYFHIVNFGKIKRENKPVYELAVEMSDQGMVQKLTRLLKYPQYLPINIGHLLREMMISFSGLGDQTCVLVLKNYIERCEAVSKGFKRLIIECADYLTLWDMDKVVTRMMKNKKRHEGIFKHLNVDILDSQESTDI